MTEGPDVPWDDLEHIHLWRTYYTNNAKGMVYQRCMRCGAVRSLPKAPKGGVV